MVPNPKIFFLYQNLISKVTFLFFCFIKISLLIWSIYFLEPQLEAAIEKQAKEIIKKEIKVTPEDIKKYTGPYGSWSPEYLAKKEAERAHEQKKHDQRSSGVLPG
jgi:predicted nuclease of restriction endonuclease-like RecB superfamily